MRALALIAGLIAVVASAGTIEDNIPDARYREYGETFALYTCRVFGMNTEGSVQMGTCTLLSPHWALTAAHVVGDLTDCTVLSESGLHRVDRIFVHREYVGDHGWHDIALIHVVKPFWSHQIPADD